MVATPDTQPERFDLVHRTPNAAQTVAIAIAEIDFGYRYVAVSVQWSCHGVVAALTPEAAVLEAIATIRAAHPESGPLRFVANLRRDSPIWTQAVHVEHEVSDWWIERPTPADRFMVHVAMVRIHHICAPVLPRPPVDRGPLIVATDGSVRHERAGFAWLSETGRYGVDGYRSARKRVGFESVLVAELHAIGAAVSALPRHRLTVLCDSRNAIAMVNRWMRRESVMPRGYPDRCLERDWCLHAVRRRLFLDRDRVDVQWVRGHSGVPLNSGANALARLSSGRFRAALSEEEFLCRAARFAGAFAAEHRRINGSADVQGSDSATQVLCPTAHAFTATGD